jgi:hypothetical protein
MRKGWTLMVSVSLLLTTTIGEVQAASPQGAGTSEIAPLVDRWTIEGDHLFPLDIGYLGIGATSRVREARVPEPRGS